MKKISLILFVLFPFNVYAQWVDVGRGVYVDPQSAQQKGSFITMSTAVPEMPDGSGSSQSEVIIDCRDGSWAYTEIILFRDNFFKNLQARIPRKEPLKATAPGTPMYNAWLKFCR